MGDQSSREMVEEAQTIFSIIACRSHCVSEIPNACACMEQAKECVAALQARPAADRAEIVRLRAALKPFADLARGYEDREDQINFAKDEWHLSDTGNLTVGDVRRAATVMRRPLPTTPAPADSYDVGWIAAVEVCAKAAAGISDKYSKQAMELAHREGEGRAAAKSDAAEEVEIAIRSLSSEAGKKEEGK